MRLLQRIKPKKLNATGVGHHALIALFVISAIAGIGAWRVWSSSAATITATQCKNIGGVWLDLRGNGIDHGPCWSTPGAYLINYGTGKVGDGIDHVPLSGNNPETGTSRSEKFNYPNYIIVVSGKWQACGERSCTNSLDPFTRSRSTPYRTSTGGEAHLNGGKYNLCSYSFYWYSSGTRSYSKFCSDPGIHLRRI